ncbi:hypothetical protein X948_3588 [Burkholderia pseudomallei MSHR5608]|nr:hypothetical protein X948_3588 [Burkholderia pseudomallei MSHR5608]
MPSIMPMISAIFDERSLMSFIVSTTRSTTELPRSATSDAFDASPLACCAFSAFCRTVDVSSSMLAAVSCSDAACSSVREDRSRLPAAIWPDAVATASLPMRTRSTTRFRLSFMSPSALSNCPVSSFDAAPMCVVRSPSATVRANFTALPIGFVIEREISTPSHSTSTSTTAAADASSVTARSMMSFASFEPAWPRSTLNARCAASAAFVCCASSVIRVPISSPASCFLPSRDSASTFSRTASSWLTRARSAASNALSLSLDSSVSYFAN